MTWVSGQKLHKNKYEIKRELGRGRIAITYLAEDRKGKKVVIKTLNLDILNRLSDRDRKDQNMGLKPPKEYNPNISDKVDRAIMHGMELEG